MSSSITLRFIALCAALTGAGGVFAHVALPAGGAAAGSDYDAVFRVGHPCTDAHATTGIAVRVPAGFALRQAEPRAGWKLDVRPPTAGASDGGEVRWTAESPQAALPARTAGEFVLRGRLTSTPGPLWFKVLQTCATDHASISADWAQVPTRGTSTEGLSLPAVRLDVLAPGVAAVDVQGAWARASVPGQSGTGAFMNLQAPSGARLVGINTPVAGVAQVHEMKMEGDMMKMRAMKGVELPPRKLVELKPGGSHVMLMDLKQPLVAGSTVPLTLQFEDAKGSKSALELQVPVLAAPPGATGHDHMHIK